MKYILLHIILLTSIVSWSQSDQKLIVNDTIRVRGIYHTFEDFKYNRPDTSIEFKVINNDLASATTFLKGNGGMRYFDQEKNEWIKPKSKIWGYCDGEKSYILFKLKNTKFEEIEYYGIYCVFGVKGNMQTEIITGVSTYNTFNIYHFFNMTNGTIYRLNITNVKTAILSDIELYNEFEKQKQKKKYLLEYILRFNERNK